MLQIEKLISFSWSVTSKTLKKLSLTWEMPAFSNQISDLWFPPSEDHLKNHLHRDCNCRLHYQFPFGLCSFHFHCFVEGLFPTSVDLFPFEWCNRCVGRAAETFESNCLFACKALCLGSQSVRTDSHFLQTPFLTNLKLYCAYFSHYDAILANS